MKAITYQENKVDSAETVLCAYGISQNFPKWPAQAEIVLCAYGISFNSQEI